jgi:hypothetical protein
MVALAVFVWALLAATGLFAIVFLCHGVRVGRWRRNGHSGPPPSLWLFWL